MVDERRKVVLSFVVAIVFGGMCLYGAVGNWIGVAQAVGGTRTPGTVTDVRCGYRSACTGAFTSDDGRIRDRRMRVAGVGSHRDGTPAVFVQKIDNGLTGAIQSDDTAYVGTVDLDVAGSVVVGIILSVLGLVLVVPLILIAVLALTRRRRSGPALARGGLS